MSSGKRSFWYFIDQILGLLWFVFVIGGIGGMFAGFMGAGTGAIIFGAVMLFGYLIVRAIVWAKIDDN